VDFFDDDATQQLPARPRPRRRGSARRTRIQRLVLLLVVLFVVIFALSLWIRSCQRNRKIESYRTYFSGVGQVINDSNALGKAVDGILRNPAKYTNKTLADKLRELAAKQQEIATRAQRIHPPAKLSELQSIFVLGMQTRQTGFEQLRDYLLAVLNKAKKVTAGTIVDLGPYFSGPDAYYTGDIYTQAQKIMSADGVSDVTVPTSTYYLTTDIFDPSRITAMLAAIKQAPQLHGIQGVGLVGVTAQPQGTKLAASGTTNVKASTDLAFAVQVQNQGTVTETSVHVTVEFQPSGAAAQTLTGTIPVIQRGATQSVNITGINIPSGAIGRVSKLTVTVAKVPQEQKLDNNTAKYSIILAL
jgi:hypothetical protein